jgi:hypothetical protein
VPGFTPTNASIQAFTYVRERRVCLEAFLTDFDVPAATPEYHQFISMESLRT